MRRTALLIALAGIAAACANPAGGRSNEGGNASNSGSGSATIAGSNSGATGAGSNGSSGGCAPAGTPVDVASLCCSGAVDANGACAEADASTGSSAASTSTSTGGSGSTGGQGTTTSAGSATTTTGAGFGGATTSSSCYPNDSYVGPGNATACCSGAIDASGYCVDPNATTSTSGTTTSGTTTSGTTTGGTTTGTTTGGTTGGNCSAACYSARGYHCDNGQCVLNGGSGPIQVTLLWDTTLQTNNQRAREDLDLHLFDPNGCEIYYGNRTCGAGSLDLDQNPACSNTDNSGGFGDDTENIIYDPTAAPLHGSYHVYVDDYEDRCDGSTPNPFKYQVTIRYNGQTQVFSGQFHQGDDDSNMQVAPGWVHIADFNY